METKILVVYIGVAGIRSEDIEDFVKKISKRIIPSTFQGEIIVIPIQSYDTRIECINPQYITDEQLINEHSLLMKNFNEDLEYQINLIKTDKDEQN